MAFKNVFDNYVKSHDDEVNVLLITFLISASEALRSTPRTSYNLLSAILTGLNDFQFFFDSI